MPNAQIVDRKSLVREMFIHYRAGEYADALGLVEQHGDLLSDDVERDWYRTVLRALRRTIATKLARRELRHAAAARGLKVAVDVEETGSGSVNNRPASGE